MSGLEVLFAALAVLAAAAGMLAVTGTRVVHCALWLVVCLGALSGVYLVLGAEVVALVQLLVYVGAVVVLVIFALMLTRAPVEPSDRLDGPPCQRLAAGAAGISVGGLLAGTLIYALGGRTVQVQGDQGSAQTVGKAVFSGWLLPFELLSVLLLAALVAAIAVSRNAGR
ncbi:NADH-quinone oxidoreductase subunit J [Kineosporia sp. J2-2]|uniref:NADH-quinone oxidoreductase subunit J n=1 Tax=Kineosporia corallincola TaxID=2835133 RepID=A0ABS5T9Q6_9ACTN|nr:NADH-quinone oxidoreductase subunit J [Kineosporia corallincola]MBT0767802.1 NADH-quinone oxidoreductase subunit J [Kineosporia corallincola]